MFGITFLTYNDKEILIPTVINFFEKTTLPENTVVHILAQNSSSNFKKLVENIKQTYSKYEIHLHFTVNFGLSTANNFLFNLTKDCEYVLHIEDDWQIHPDTDNNWLLHCLKIMKNLPHISTIALRRYISDAEKYSYGWSRTIPYYCHVFKDNFDYQNKLSEKEQINLEEFADKKVTVQYIKHFLFTFNPVIRRNSDYVREKIFPLPFTTETRNSNWGWCEAVTMEKHRDLNTLLYENGVFLHFDDNKEFCKEHSLGLFYPFTK